MVSLTHGLALRRAANRYQYVCPAAWGDMAPAPVAALADGTIVVGATSGLKLLGVDGRVRAHPDPIAAGSTREIVRSAQGVFSVRNTQAGSEVLAVDAQTARVLWTDTQSLYSMAALDPKLVLVRNGEFMLEQVTIAMADGRELERQAVVTDIPVDYVFARASAGTAYALVMFRSATALGSLSMNAFTAIAEGELWVAGPLRAGDSTLLAVDGALSQLVGGEIMPLAEPDNVLCLAQDDDLSYACNSLGIARVSGQSLAEELFELTWLAGPDLTLLEGEAQPLCNSQWQDLRVDLMLAGMSLLVDEMPDPGSAGSAGTSSLPVAGMATAGAIAAGTGASQAGAAGAARVAGADPGGESASCAAMSSKGDSLALYLCIALVFVARRRTRAASPARTR